ncbi:MAG: hypothetical protein J1G06_08655 [Oscillospiraceae bacterium]|nr:hypothetical protein [Oscillospiraceae bacterium]
MTPDKHGRYTDCHFLKKSGIRQDCTALKDFYNVDDIENQCKGCPFFKTDEEFEKGWANRKNRK